MSNHFMCNCEFFIGYYASVHSSVYELENIRSHIHLEAYELQRIKVI
jgi:hypothetical protein